MIIHHIHKKQRGFSMLELLVSLLVLSLGLLGLAVLQTSSLRYTHDGNMRGVATSQVNAMADRMRANNDGIELGNYDNISGIPGDPGCSTCTPAQTAQRDTFQWNTTNATLLPSGQGQVAVNGNIHTITVMWDSQRTGATGTGCGNNPEVDLTCLSANIRF